MKVKAIGKRYLIELEQAAKVSESGLLMDSPTNASMAPVIGVIVGVGDDCKFQVGTKIFFRRFSLDEMKFVSPTGEQIINFMEEKDIIGLIENENANVKTEVI